MMDSLTPRRSRKNSFGSRRHKKETKNPYSTRGLDKFSALLAELEEKKQKIYSQKGSEDISFVHFVYKDSDNCVPIVVKVKKDKKQDKTKSSGDEIKEILPAVKHESETQDKFPVDHSASRKDEVKQSEPESDNKMSKKIIKSFSFNKINLNNLRLPSYYLPAAIILILFFLACFGRSFAILCTSIGWYIVPMLQVDSSSNEKSHMKKKYYDRRTSEMKMVSNELSSPRSTSNSGAVNGQLPGQRGHWNSW